MLEDLKYVTSERVYSLMGHQTQNSIISIYNVKWEESNSSMVTGTEHGLQSQAGLRWTLCPALAGRGTWSFFPKCVERSPGGL